MAVAIATRNRRDELLEVVGRLTALPDQPDVIVADNASTDGSADAVSDLYPDVVVLRLGHNMGCAARNVAATATKADLLAFADDDSWWAPGALTRAAEIFDAHPRLALLAARIVVGPQERFDPACEIMRDSPLPREDDLPGPSILGFVACGAVVRRTAFLAAGGFAQEFVIGGEENLLAWDLAAAGWGLAYCDSIVAHHHPSPARNVSRRRRRQMRNDLWTTWLRRSLPHVVRHTAHVAAMSRGDPDVRAALLDAVRNGGWVLTQRRRLPATVERQLSLLEQTHTAFLY